MNTCESSQHHLRMAAKNLLLCAVFLLTAACAPARASQLPQNTATRTTSSQTAAPTQTVPTPADTLTATPVPSPTNMPTPSPTPTPLACRQEPGHVEQTSLRSAALKLPMEVRVYLPPCYAQDAERAYPVLYLIHGMNNTEAQWDDLGADETADRLILSGEVPPFIIVMPRDRLWKEPSETSFDEVFLQELIPWVDAHYRTRPERADRAVGGLSRGGAWALHFGFSRADLFGAVGAHSAPIFWEDANAIKGWLDTLPPEQLPRLYMDIGEKDYLRRSNTWLEELLTARGIPHEYYSFPGYHEDAYWSAHVEDYLRWYAAGW
jgi:enterochelin esterase-like enzyme